MLRHRPHAPSQHAVHHRGCTAWPALRKHAQDGLAVGFGIYSSLQSDDSSNHDRTGFASRGEYSFASTLAYKMAEAFGIFTGVASLADIAVRVGTDLSQMSRDMKNAPEDIQALSNEVNDIRAVLKVLEELRLDNAADSRILSTEGILKQLERELAQAKTVLNDLDMLVKGCQSRKTFETRFKWWRKNKNQADCLRRQLREVRNRILELLSAFNGCSVQELL